ncbi:ABC transporter permease [Paeniglutamicibacter psychrophenolicus]|uniref:Peptide/nickel transport system permease protein n=1 Tax=Paeniglutamicibacter psychrophenolicus TaxID=257454 RepID=A0ABS4WBA1_9MICC|nr:ABC transporter permease [Paeniglutamicibacter psychrophenolicus]MBP2372879.1 peptide/nickel transport system permease protein [Paeniglutamicibacter psychrophenolicus]
MTRFVLIRTARALLAIWIAVTITFFLLRLLPGGPTTLMLDGLKDPELEAALMSEYGLDKSLIVQYGLFLWNLVQGNFGTSFYSQSPVMDVLATRIPWTLLLAGTAFLVTLLIGIPLGVAAAARRGGIPDQVLRFLGMAGQAMFVPSVAVFLLAVFALGTGWFPIGGAVDSFAEGGGVFTSILLHLALPLLTLIFIQTGPYALTVRTNMLQVLGSDYIRSAKARGLSRRTVIWNHGLRNAMIPAVTLMGLQLGTLVGGAVLTETVFAYPGLGSLIYESVLRQDFPILQGAFILLAVTVVAANLLTDVVCLFIDPKLRTGSRA